MTDDIGFKIYAMIDGLKESMGQATTAVTKFSSETKAQIQSVGAAFESLNKFVLGFAGVLAGGIIFKDLIESTEKWTNSVVSLAKQFGITTEEASGLAAALKNIGVSTEEYQSAATKLDRQVKSNEQNVNALGVATRNSSGALLSQQQIMLNALKTLNDYKEGTDRNIAAQFLLGRNTSDLGNLLRLTSDEISRGADDAERFGLIVGGDDYENTIKFQRSMSELNLSILGLERALGDKIIPALTHLAETFTTTVIPAIGQAIDKIKEFEQVFGSIYALMATADDPEMRDQLLDEMNGVPYGKNQPAAAKTGGTYLGDQGTKTVPEGFGKADQTGSDNQVQVWQQGLTDMLYQQQVFGEQAKQEELEYWQFKIQETQTGSQEQLAIEQKIYTLQSEMQKTALAEQGKEYKAFFDTIDHSLDGMLQGVLQGTQTWQEAMAHVYDNLAISFVEAIAKMAVRWAAFQATSALGWTQMAGAIGNPLSGGAGAAGGSSMLQPLLAALGLQTVATTANTTAQFGATASNDLCTVATDENTVQSALNWAATMLNTAALEIKSLFGFAGGGVPPIGVPSMVGENGPELFVPNQMGTIIPNHSLGIGGGGGGISAASSTNSSGGISVTIQVNAIDTQSGMDFINDQAENIADVINQQIRNGNPALTGQSLTTGRY